MALGVPPNGVQKLISQNQEVNINATGPWPLDDLHLQYLNITFFIIFIWSGGSIYALAKISQLIQSTVWLPHAGHLINIHELTPIDAASYTPPACGCKSQSGAQARITLEILGIISHDL